MEKKIMVTLEPMQQADFETFIENEMQGYAAAHVRNGNWPEEGALEKSKQETEYLLPDGIHTKDQYLWSIMEDGIRIGSLWVQIKDRKAFIFDFVIDEAFRGKGFAKQALIAMDKKLESMDVVSVSLHVFGDNTIAQDLYRKMGFEITGIHMQKKLIR